MADGDHLAASSVHENLRELQHLFLHPLHFTRHDVLYFTFFVLNAEQLISPREELSIFFVEMN